MSCLFARDRSLKVCYDYRYSAVEVSSSNCRRTERAALVSLTDRERACAQLARRREEGGRSAGREKGRGRVLAAQLAGIREEGGAGGRCWMLRSRCCHFDYVVVVVILTIFIF